MNVEHGKGTSRHHHSWSSGVGRKLGAGVGKLYDADANAAAHTNWPATRDGVQTKFELVDAVVGTWGTTDGIRKRKTPTATPPYPWQRRCGGVAGAEQRISTKKPAQNKLTAPTWRGRRQKVRIFYEGTAPAKWAAQRPNSSPGVCVI
ncbi:hypothetical protein KR026_000174 [Drosophila bipectinata]|nr:hypothetical protein KR026_000174 [Drosophila bipectinata]